MVLLVGLDVEISDPGWVSSNHFCLCEKTTRDERDTVDSAVPQHRRDMQHHPSVLFDVPIQIRWPCCLRLLQMSWRGLQSFISSEGGFNNNEEKARFRVF